MLHYYVSTESSYDWCRENFEDLERLESLKRSLGKPAEYLAVDGKVKIEVKPTLDAILIVNFYGLGSEGRWFIWRSLTVAATEMVADLCWKRVEETYMMISDQPLYRSMDLPLPKQPKSLPWATTISLLNLFNEDEKDEMENYATLMTHYIAQAWYERVVFGPPESVDPAN